MFCAIMAAAGAIVGAIEEEKDFRKRLAKMPEEAQKEAISARKESIRTSMEERRHREIVEATKKQNSGPLAFVLGLIIGGSR